MSIKPRGSGLQIDVQVTVNGETKRHREITRGTMDEARLREAQIKLDLRAGHTDKVRAEAPNAPPVAKLLLTDALEQTWDRYWSKGGMARTVRSNMRSCEEFFGADTPLANIDNAAADDFVVWLGGKGYTPSTIRSKVCVMTKTFGLFHRRGNIGSVPHFDLPSIGDNLRDRLITDTEFSQLHYLFASEYDNVTSRRKDGQRGDDYVALLVILMDTGARRSEVAAINAANLRGDMLTLRDTKNGKMRTLPLTSRALEALQLQVERHGLQPFAWATTGTLRHAWDWARNCMNLSNDPGFIPYALRHTCASTLYAKTKDIVLVKEWLGHSDIKMTMRYAKLQPDALAAARDLMEAT